MTIRNEAELGQTIRQLGRLSASLKSLAAGCTNVAFLLLSQGPRHEIDKLWAEIDEYQDVDPEPAP